MNLKNLAMNQAELILAVIERTLTFFLIAFLLACVLFLIVFAIKTFKKEEK